jgi:hypothetical protein
MKVNSALSGQTPIATEFDDIKSKGAGVIRRFCYELLLCKRLEKKATATTRSCAYIRRHHLGIVAASGSDWRYQAVAEMGLRESVFKRPAGENFQFGRMLSLGFNHDL